MGRDIGTIATGHDLSRSVRRQPGSEYWLTWQGAGQWRQQVSGCIPSVSEPGEHRPANAGGEGDVSHVATLAGNDESLLVGIEILKLDAGRFCTAKTCPDEQGDQRGVASGCERRILSECVKHLFGPSLRDVAATLFRLVADLLLRPDRVQSRVRLVVCQDAGVERFSEN